jgi:hypothetical protein
MMSFDEHDYRYEEFLAELYEEHRDQAIEEFRVERLQAYYRANPSVAHPAATYLNEGRALIEVSPSAALIFAAVSAEQSFKSVLLHPLVYGLVSDDAVAALVADLVISQAGLDRFGELLFAILAHVAGIDLRIRKRDGSGDSLWEEMRALQRRRNQLLHRAQVAKKHEAETALLVSAELLNGILPAVLDAVELHLHEASTICSDPRCIEQEMVKKLTGSLGLDGGRTGV